MGAGRARGFTLIELLVVMVILGVTLGLVSLTAMPGQKQAVQQAAATATPQPVTTATVKKPADAAAAQTAAATEAAPVAEQAVAEQQPKKRPFWKLWGN